MNANWGGVTFQFHVYIYKNNNNNIEFRVRFGIQRQHKGPLLAINFWHIELAKMQDEEVENRIAESQVRWIYFTTREK